MRDSEKSGYLSFLQVNRAQAIQLLLVGLVLAVGVDLLAGYLGSQLSKSETLIVALAAIAVALLFLLWRAFRPQPRDRHFEGFFVYDRRENALAKHDLEYDLGYSLTKYLTAAFAENSSIKAIWDRNPLSDLINRDNNATGDPHKSLDLIRQATEYFVLQSFSTRLSDHFNSGDYNQDELDTLSHTDLPDVLLQNRFMRLFTEPMEDRAAFLSGDRPPADMAGIVVANAAGGALYERFELVLPKGWRVKRSAENQIEILTRRFTLTVRTECEGWGAVLPLMYLSDYLGLREDPGDGFRYSEMTIDVSIRIAPRHSWLMTSKGWKYYRWIDSWIEALEPEISQQAYLNRIGFATAQTTFQLVKSLRRNRDTVSSSSSVTSSGDNADQALVGTAKIPGMSSKGRPPFDIGDQVEHASFGLGRVTAVEPGGVVVVQFDGDQSTRKLMASYAPLRRVESSTD